LQLQLNDDNFSLIDEFQLQELLLKEITMQTVIIY